MLVLQNNTKRLTISARFSLPLRKFRSKAISLPVVTVLFPNDRRTTQLLAKSLYEKSVGPRGPLAGMLQPASKRGGMGFPLRCVKVDEPVSMPFYVLASLGSEPRSFCSSFFS